MVAGHSGQFTPGGYLSTVIHTTLVGIDWLSMVLRLHQHNIGYTVDGFYRSDDPTNSVKVGIEPKTFRLLVRSATSRATELYK